MLVENIILRNVIINRGAAEVDKLISRDDFWLLVENIILPNVIINRGAAEVDKLISRDDFSTSNLSRMLYLFYYIEH